MQWYWASGDVKCLYNCSFPISYESGGESLEDSETIAESYRIVQSYQTISPERCTVTSLSKFNF